MLNRYRLLRLLFSLSEARKAVFDVTCQLGPNVYTFTLDRTHGITVNIKNEETDAQVISVYDSVDKINIPDGNYKIIKLVESIYTPSKRLYSQNINYCIEPIQIYLPVFRVLGEQVVFLLKHRDGIKKMYFINGRVFYTDVTKDSMTLYQTDLRKIFSDFPNSEILLFERLSDRYSYSNIFEECKRMCVNKGKTWNFVKKGVVV